MDCEILPGSKSRREAKRAARGQQQPSLSVTTETEAGDYSPVAERTDEDKYFRAGWSLNRKTPTPESCLGVSAEAVRFSLLAGRGAELGSSTQSR